MLQQLEAAQSALPQAIEAESQKAFNAVERQMLDQVRSIDDQVSQLGLRIGTVGVSRLDAELARVRSEFATFGNQLDAAEANLARKRLVATVPARAQIDAVQAQIEKIRAGLPEALEISLTLKTDEAERQMRDTLRGMEDQMDQMSMQLGAAGLDRLGTDLSRIDRSFAALLDKVQALDAALEKLNIGATAEQQDAILKARTRIATQFSPEQIEQGRQQALIERQEREGRRVIEAMENRLDDMQQFQGPQTYPMGDSPETRRLARAAQNKELTEEQRQRVTTLRQQMLAQERLNYAAGLFVDVGQSVGAAWTEALLSIADGTKTVSQAFQAMAQSIIQSLIQIASQEAFNALIHLGVRLIMGGVGPAPAGSGLGAAPITSGGGMAFGGGVGGGFIAGMGGAAGGGFGFQHGGIVHAPTMAMIGENPATAPEAIFNRQQLQSLFGGQAANQAGNAGISIINVASKAQAETTAAQERTMGRHVVINYVLEELNLGEGSRINRTMRSMQR
jgi:hypothetical protein